MAPPSKNGIVPLQKKGLSAKQYLWDIILVKNGMDSIGLFLHAHDVFVP